MLALASGATLPEAALVGCLVASITVQQLATTGTATPAQVLERLTLWQERTRLRVTNDTSAEGLDPLMSDERFAINYLTDLAGLLPKLDTKRIGEAITAVRKVRDDNKTIYICGNGGSASIASQMVVDIVKGASFKKKARFKMIGLTDSMATVSAYANDEGYEVVFAEPLKNFAVAGDLLDRHQRQRQQPQRAAGRRICQHNRLHDDGADHRRRG